MYVTCHDSPKRGNHADTEQSSIRKQALHFCRSHCASEHGRQTVSGGACPAAPLPAAASAAPICGGNHKDHRGARGCDNHRRDPVSVPQTAGFEHSARRLIHFKSDFSGVEVRAWLRSSSSSRLPEPRADIPVCSGMFLSSTPLHWSLPPAPSWLQQRCCPPT